MDQAFIDQCGGKPGALRLLRRVVRRVVRRVPGAAALAHALHRLIDPQVREIHRLRTDESAHVYQPFPVTFEDRYPDLFDLLAARLADLPAPRILSFGCSNGAEVRALRRRLPKARIVGIDVNRLAIAEARKADPVGEYRVAAAPAPADRFDAILAMAVFRHGELDARKPDSCSAVLPFARFATGIAALDRCLVPGGWLAVFNAQFRVCDTPSFSHYEVDPFVMPDFAPQLLLYGPDDRRMEGVEEPSVLYRKAGAS